jgi:hypothetical protein
MKSRRKGFLELAFVLIFLSPAFAVGPDGKRMMRFYLELDQMTCLKAGLEIPFTDRLGLKGSLGLSPFGITTWSYDLAGFYRIIDGPGPFKLSSEFGLNLACVNILEGTLVDWDPHMAGPFAGFAPGINLNWAYAFREQTLGLKTGVFYYMEYQNAGWNDPSFIPEVTLEYIFTPQNNN